MPQIWLIQSKHMASCLSHCMQPSEDFVKKTVASKLGKEVKTQCTNDLIVCIFPFLPYFPPYMYLKAVHFSELHMKCRQKQLQSNPLSFWYEEQKGSHKVQEKFLLCFFLLFSSPYVCTQQSEEAGQFSIQRTMKEEGDVYADVIHDN